MNFGRRKSYFLRMCIIGIIVGVIGIFSVGPFSREEDRNILPGYVFDSYEAKVNVDGDNNDYFYTKFENAIKSVVDKQSATIEILKDLQVANTEPIEILSDIKLVSNKKLTMTGTAALFSVLGSLEVQSGTYITNTHRFATLHEGANLLVKNGTFTGLQADNDGGIVYNNFANVEILNGRFEGKSTKNNGGVIFNNGGDIKILGGTFSGNTALANGGVIFNSLGNVEVAGGLFVSNNAANGSVVYNDGNITLKGGDFSSSISTRAISHMGEQFLIEGNLNLDQNSRVYIENQNSKITNKGANIVNMLLELNDPNVDGQNKEIVEGAGPSTLFSVYNYGFGLVRKNGTYLLAKQVNLFLSAGQESVSQNFDGWQWNSQNNMFEKTFLSLGNEGTTILSLPVNVSKQGYAFQSWYALENEEKTQVVLGMEIPLTDSTFYADWVLNVFTITVRQKGGLGLVSQEFTHSMEEQVINIEIPEIENYTITKLTTITSENTSILNMTATSFEVYIPASHASSVVIEVDGETSTNGLEFEFVQARDAYVVSDYVGQSTDVVIPSLYNGENGIRRVVEVKDEALRWKEPSLTSVQIGANIEIIGRSAFFNNNLTNIIIPDSVKVIDQSAFASNNLETVIVGNGVVSIGVGAFQINQIITLTLGESVQTIEERAFNSNQIEGALTIPNSVEQIEKDAFSANKITSITLGNSLMYIGERAFADNLISNHIVIPDSVQTIEVGAFRASGASNDNEIIGLTLGAGLKTIAGQAFAYNKITSLTIPNNITSIGVNAFASNNIQTLIIGSGLSVIEESVFSGNDLSSVNIPATVESIKARAFFGNEIENLVFVNGLKTIEQEAFGENGVISVELSDTVETIGQQAFFSSYLTNLVLGEGLKHVGASAFENHRLTNITIPSSVETIEQKAFFGQMIQNVIIQKQGTADNITKLSEFSNGNEFGYGSTIIFEVPEGFYPHYYNHSTWSQYKDQIKKETFNIIVQDTDESTVSAVVYSQEITSQTIEVEVASITDFTIVNYTILSGEGPQVLNVSKSGFSLEVPQQHFGDIIIEVEKQASTSGLVFALVVEKDYYSVVGYSGTSQNIDIPSIYNGDKGVREVKEIGVSAFNSLPVKITSINLPSSLTKIGNGAFSYNLLTAISLPDALVEIGNSAFSGNQISGNLVLPDGLETIGHWAFSGNSITSILFGEQLKVLGAYSFESNNIESLSFPNLTTIGEGVFMGNSISGHLVIPNSVISVGLNAFEGNNITSVEIGAGVEEIEDSTFANNNIETLIIPATIKKIKDSAFINNQIYALTLSEGLEELGNRAFYGNFLTNIVVPSSVKLISLQAFAENENIASVVMLRDISLGDITKLHSQSGSNDEFGANAELAIIVPSESFTNYLDDATWSQYRNNLQVKTYDIVIKDTLGEVIATGSYYQMSSSQTKTVVLPELEGKTIVSFNIEVLGILIASSNEAQIQVLVSSNMAQDIEIVVQTELFTDGLVFTYNNLTETYIVSNYFGSSTEIVVPSLYNGDFGILEVSIIEEGLFFNKGIQITSLILGENIYEIRKDAFRGNLLESVVFPNSVNDIGEASFRDNQITSIVLGSSVETIRGYAFGGNSITGKLTFPNSMRAVMFASFAGNNITSVDFGNGLSSIENAVFDNNQIQGTLTIPNSVIEIGSSAFQGNQISEVNLGSGLRFIRSGAFQNNQITSLLVPSSVEQIANNAFNGNGLVSVILQRAETGNNITRLATSPIGNEFGTEATLEIRVASASLSSYYDHATWTQYKDRLIAF